MQAMPSKTRTSFSQIAIICAAVFGSGAAHAASISCSGNYLGYSFSVTTRTSGERVSKNIRLVITNSGGVVTQSSLPPTSSDIKPGQYLRFAGKNADGMGAIDANFNASDNTYRGNLEAQSAKTGAINVDVVCQLSGTRSAMLQPQRDSVSQAGSETDLDTFQY